ncbi:MAG: hypothetical protein NVS2B3_18080 [Vulcanimicrobiaceae bacterium]
MIFVLIIAIAALAGVFARAPVRSAAHAGSARVVPWIVALLSGSFATHACLIVYAARTQVPFPAWLSSAPIVPIADLAPLFGHTPPRVSEWIEAISVTESLGLAALWFALGETRVGARTCRLVAVAAIVMAAASVALPASASADLYAYVGDARLGRECYDGTAHFASTPLDAIARFWGDPFVRCSYGPVWIAWVHALVGARPLGTAIVLLRLLDLAAFGAVLLALRALAMPPRFIALVALDPALYLQFIADGHNDLFMVSLVLWARACAMRRWPWPSVLLGACAGASKITFLALAPLAFVGIGSSRARSTFVTMSVAGGIALSAWLGGDAYWRALRFTAAAYRTGPSDVAEVAAVLTAGLALVAVALAIFRSRVRWPATFGCAGLGTHVFPWYLAWGLPYAVLDAQSALPYLASLPILTFGFSTTYGISPAWQPLGVIALVAALLAFYACVRGFDRNSIVRR